MATLEQVQQMMDQVKIAKTDTDATIKLLIDEIEDLKKDQGMSEKKDDGYKYPLVNEKGMADLEKYGGDFKEYEDWNFNMSMFLSRKKFMSDFLKWIEEQTVEPDEVKIKFSAHLMEVQESEFEDLNKQMFEVLVFKVTGNGTTMAKNLFKNSEIHGAVLWWRLKNEALGKTAVRMQNVAAQVFRPDRVSKYSDITAALDEFDTAVKLYTLGGCNFR